MPVTMLVDTMETIHAGDYVEVAYRYKDGDILNTRKIVQGKGQEPLLYIEARGTIFTLREKDGSIPKEILRVTLLPFRPPVSYKAGPMPRDPRTLAPTTSAESIYTIKSEDPRFGRK